MWMLLCFALGIGNFAAHRAVTESGHPFVEDTKRYFGVHFGRYASYTIEYVILTAAMLLASAGYSLVALLYVIYSGLNALAAWLLLSGRV
jgi:hypothetical protein